MQQTQQQQMHFQEDIVALLGHGMLAFDEDQRITSCNGRLERLGLSSANASGKTVAQVLAPLLQNPERLGDVTRAISLVFETGTSALLKEVGVNFPTRRNQMYHFVVTRVSGSPPGGAILFQNITETLRMREYFERVLDSTPDGIFVIDKDRQVRLFNRASGYITGRNPEEILHLGLKCDEVINCHTEEGESLAHTLCPAKSIFGGGNGNQREEMLITNADGSERWVETTYSPIRNEAGEVEYVISILRDVHERKMLEERLHQSEKLASLGQLVAGIAHEIKNPLAIMLTSLDIMDSKSHSKDQRREAARFLREEIIRIDERLKSFLAFARPRALELKPMVLSSLIKHSADAMILLFPEIEFNVELLRPEPIVMGDREALSQVLTNLVFNAADAMNNKGRITLRVRPKADTAIIDVEDEGPGIPEDHTTRIFDPFFTTRADGTGLGLSICYQIVLGHRGTISVRNRPDGGGACFGVCIPMAAQAENPA